jgi:hypothetical protein
MEGDQLTLTPTQHTRGGLEGKVNVKNADVLREQFAQSCDGSEYGRDGWLLTASRGHCLQAKLGVRSASALILLYVHRGIYKEMDTYSSLDYLTSAESMLLHKCRGRSRRITSRLLRTARAQLFARVGAGASEVLRAMLTSLVSHLEIGAKGKGSCVLASALVGSLAECATAEAVAGVNADEAVRIHLGRGTAKFASCRGCGAQSVCSSESVRAVAARCRCSLRTRSSGRPRSARCLPRQRRREQGAEGIDLGVQIREHIVDAWLECHHVTTSGSTVRVHIREDSVRVELGTLDDVRRHDASGGVREGSEEA